MAREREKGAPKATAKCLVYRPEKMLIVSDQSDVNVITTSYQKRYAQPICVRPEIN